MNFTMKNSHNTQDSEVKTGPKLLKMITTFLQKKKVAVAVPETVHTIQFHIGYGDFIATIKSNSTDELYAHVELYQERRMLNHGRFYIMHGSKPILRGRSIEDYGIHNFATLQVEFPQMLGGASNTPTPPTGVFTPIYTHVAECEAELLEGLRVQSNEQRDYNFATMMKHVMKNVEGVFPKIESDWIVTQIENFSVLHRMGRKCTDVNDYYALTQIAYRLFTGRCATIEIMKRIDNLFKVEVQALDVGTTLGVLRSAFNFTAQISECEMSKKLTSLYSFLLVQGYLQQFGLTVTDEDYSKMEQRALFSAFSSKKAFYVHVLDTALFICERCHEMQMTGDITVFLHSSSEYSEWLKEADRILNLSPFVGNLAAHNTSYFSFISDMRGAIEKGEAYARYTKAMAGVDCKIIYNKLMALRLLQNTEITRSAAQQERAQPMGVLIYGSSSIAKSAFTKMMFTYYGSLYDLEKTDEYRYVRNPMDEYWSNFDTSKWCIQLDDIAFANPASSNEIDPTLKDLLNVVNNVPYVPPQAALEDKGKTPVKAELVLATTNCAHLNAETYFWCPLAVRRRLPYVVSLRPKKEYLHENQVFIDPAKIVTEDGKYPDLWEIEVKKIKPVINNPGAREQASLETVAIFSNVNEFLQHFGNACETHKENQKRAMKKDDDMAMIAVCKKCKMPLPHDECLVVQGGCTVTAWWVFLIWCLDWLVKTSLFMACVKYGASRPIVNRVSFWIMNNITDSVHSIRFFGGLCESMRDPRYKRLLACTAFIGLMYGMYVVHTNWDSDLTEETEKSKKSKPQKVEAEDSIPIDEELELQGNIHGTTEDQLLKESTSNVWYNPQLELTTFDVPKASSSMVGISPSQVRELMGKNTVLLYVRIAGQNKRRVMRGTFLVGHQLVTNAHAFEDFSEEYSVQIIRSPADAPFNNNITVIVQRRNIAFHPKLDLCMLEINNVPPFKDLRPFWSHNEIEPSSALELVRKVDGGVEMRNLFGLMYHSCVPTKCGTVPIFMGKSSEETMEGMCGSLTVAVTPRGPIIIGIHMLGNGNDIGVQRVMKEDLDLLSEMPCISKRPIVQSGFAPMLSCSKKTFNLVEPHYKSLLRYIPDGTADVYGSFSGFRPKPKTRVCATPIQEEILEHFNVPLAHGPPAMAGWEPWRKNVLQMVKPQPIYDEAILAECVEAFSNDIIGGLAEGWERELVILSPESTINGLPGVKYIDSMARSTSMGFPWNCTKKEFLLEAKTEKHPDGVTFTPEIWERIAHVESEYKAGRRVYPVFSGCLKDEATPLKKIADKKTRMFAGGPVDWAFVVRKYCLSFVRLCQKNPLVFEMAVGCTAQSGQWGRFRDFLTHFGDDQIVAGDYKGFDKGMLAGFILAAFTVVTNVMRRAGFTEEELLVVMCMGEDTAFPIMNVHGDLIGFYGTNPSGHPLTVIINSIVNSLYMRYAYRVENPKNEVATFKQNVHLLTYGDDNTMGVNRKMKWYNHTAIQKALADIGVVYTMADKESESVPFIHIDDVSFLKRRWLWNEHIQNWACPLEESSIHRSLTVWLPSQSVDANRQLVDVITSANNEFFFYGKERFEIEHAFFKTILARHPYCHYAGADVLPTHDELVQRFQRATEALPN